MTNIENEKPKHIRLEEKNGITQSLLHEIFDYRDGYLFWKIKKARNTKIGKRAGRRNSFLNRNYVRISGKDYLNARIIFIYHKGYIPDEVDHINHNSIDDRIENLREATRSENVRNSSSRKGSSSQYLGVQKIKRDRKKKWMVLIFINGKNTNIGSFETEVEAALTYNKFAVKHFKEFASLNIVKPIKNDVE